MKIDRLYTLSQFVDLLKEKIDNCNESFMMALSYIFRYNEFLKQPLKKGMFVNEIEYPTDDDWKNRYDWACKQNTLWQESEKKIIFKDFEMITESYNTYIHLNSVDMLITQDYNNWYNQNDEEIKSLSDLAEKTNGQLKLKNVEI